MKALPMSQRPASSPPAAAVVETDTPAVGDLLPRGGTPSMPVRVCSAALAQLPEPRTHVPAATRRERGRASVCRQETRLAVDSPRNLHPRGDSPPHATAHKAARGI
jgi:hypothetical protein